MSRIGVKGIRGPSYTPIDFSGNAIKSKLIISKKKIQRFYSSVFFCHLPIPARNRTRGLCIAEQYGDLLNCMRIHFLFIRVTSEAFKQ